MREAIAWKERLGPNCALGTDGQQWIIFRIHGPDDGHGTVWRGLRWDAVAFIHSDKRALFMAIEWHGLELSVRGRAALDRQDAKIWHWRRGAG